MKLLDIFSHIVWHPGIEDNNWAGWTTVAIYYGTALLALLLHVQSQRERQAPADSNKSYFYIWLALLLICLGVARQTGLMRWFTELGRAVAREQGWYWQRTATQKQIIQLFFYSSSLFFCFLAWLNRRAIWRYGIVLAGITILVSFLSIRAVSLHSVDTTLAYSRVMGLRLGTALEMGALLWVGVTLLLSLVFHRLVHWVHNRKESP